MNRIAPKHSRAILFAALLVCLAGGCVRSIQPIVKDEQVTTDDRLLGSWVAKDGKTSGVITAADDHRSYKLVYTDEDKKTANLIVRLGKIGDMTIADCTADKPSPDASDVYFMHLLPVHSFMVLKDATPTRLVLQTMDSKWFDNYVQAHPDELATVSIGHEDGNVISASTDDVQKFLIRHEKDAGVFGDEGIFVRPDDPTTRPSPTTDPAPVSGPPKSQ